MPSRNVAKTAQITPFGGPGMGGGEFLQLLAYWKATKEYLNERGTKIRVFRVLFRAPFLPPLSHTIPPSFPLQALFILPPLLPSSPPPFPPCFLTPGKLRFRYPSDLGTL